MLEIGTNWKADTLVDSRVMTLVPVGANSLSSMYKMTCCDLRDNQSLVKPSNHKLGAEVQRRFTVWVFMSNVHKTSAQHPIAEKLKEDRNLQTLNGVSQSLGVLM